MDDSLDEENEPLLNEPTQSTPPEITLKEEEKNSHINDEEEVEIVIYDQAYWATEHKMHVERKKTASLQVNNSSINNLQIQVNIYEENLYTFLRENIYNYTKISSRKLKEELKILKFKVIPNKSGNGSVHYVMPTMDNPLFGPNINYAGAYFNVHLPHDDGDIIPSAYFDFMKSGFANVFGLRL